MSVSNHCWNVTSLTEVANIKFHEHFELLHAARLMGNTYGETYGRVLKVFCPEMEESGCSETQATVSHVVIF